MTICKPCGVVANYLRCLRDYGAKPKKISFDVSSWYPGTCCVCKHDSTGEEHKDGNWVTETRDFFHPDTTLIAYALKKLHRVKAAGYRAPKPHGS